MNFTFSPPIPRSFGTHDGTFHADEVTACALLLTWNCIDRDKIVRSRDMHILASCEYVCDVGGIYDPKKKRFDHHQQDYQGELSSAGMVWKYLKESGYISEGLYHFFNRSLILGVDAQDTGRIELETGVCSFSGVIANFIPPSYTNSSEEIEKAFFQALDFTCAHLARLKERYTVIQSHRLLVQKAMEGRHSLLVFDTPIPWQELFFELGGEHHPAQFVIMPAGEHWKLRGIPPNMKEKMKVRLPLPAKWAGLMDKDLEKITGIKGAVFCHKGGFISVWETQQAAIEAAEKVLKKK